MRYVFVIITVSLLGGISAQATECGELKQQAAYLKAAVKAEETLRTPVAKVRELQMALKALEKKVALSCVPRRAGFSAFPLGYLAVPAGNASRITFDPGENWQLVVTAYGLSDGLRLNAPAVVKLPAGMHWEVDGRLAKAGDLMVAVATDAQLIVEETTPGKANWRIEIKGQPTLVSLAQLKTCAEGSRANLAGITLSQAACESLRRIDPLAAGSSVIPERGRAMAMGEWQYGGRTAIDLGDEELTGMAVEAGPAPRLDLSLELAAPLPGISTGRNLAVTFEGNRQTAGGGAGLHMASECGDDAACEKTRYFAELWYDRVFGVPFLRTASPMSYAATVSGRITNRLQRPIGGQRVVAVAGERRVVTITDSEGLYHFDGLMPGEITIYPVGRKMLDKPRADQVRTVVAGTSEVQVAPLFIDRLFE